MEGDRWSKVFIKKYDPLKAGSIDGTDTEPHDRGIIRALKAKYKCNKSVKGDPRKTVFVSRLNFITGEQKLREIFSEEGDIKRIRLVRDIVTGMSKGYSFIEFEEESAARRACSRMNKSIIDDKTILVDFEMERTLEGWVPRRLGGGVGGKKEAGQLRFGGRDKPFHEPIFVVQSDKRQGTFGSHDDREWSMEYETARDVKRESSHDVWDRSRRGSRDRERHRYRDSSRDRDRTRDRRSRRSRSLDRRRSRSRDRRRSRSRERRRSRSRSRERYRKRSRSRERRRSRSKSPGSPRNGKRRRDRSRD